MTFAPGFLLADVASRTTYELGRMQTLTERWHLLVLALVCAAIVALVSWLYRRDRAELKPALAALLVGLRIAAFAGLLVYYLDPQKRTERKVVHNSRAVVLVDTSLSMGLRDSGPSVAIGSPTRLAQALEVLDRGGLIRKLQEKHDVVLARFDSQTRRLQAFSKLPRRGESTQATPQRDAEKPASERTAQPSAQRFDIGAIAPQGLETRLGYSLLEVIEQNRSSPLSGVIVFSDGQQNAGIDTTSAVDAAREAGVPIFTVGIGSPRQPANVRITDFVAPSRAYPGDGFALTGYVQANGLPGQSVNVELLSRPAGVDRRESATLEGSQSVLLGARAGTTPVKFDITPAEPGRRTYRLQIKAPPEDNNPSDNFQEVDIEIVDHKTRVLLVASGPTREYVFLRNQLRRDKQMVVDVWLQSAVAGPVSQDAAKLLTALPDTAQELFEYDAIVGFDPDWTKLSASQVDLLERWVGEKSGGLIVVAGPVQMDQWVQRPALAKIRALYPVEFHRRFALADDSRAGSDTAWPIEFTREGLEAEFLWLGDAAARSQQAWAEFPGVFSYYTVRSAKPAATIYGYYSDPETAAGSNLPIYMAGQFYGSGRVFYLGSGEMWRLRAVDEGYFEQFYTKLIRQVSQGRLLAGSSRGVLLVDRDRYQLGSVVVVRAQLSGLQHEPLSAASAPLHIAQPDGNVATVDLKPDPNRKGMFVGQFTALEEGTYRLQLPVPGSNQEVLNRRIQVKVPDLERENSERNDSLLSTIASRTGARYYVGAGSVLGTGGAPPVTALLKDRTATTYLAGVTDMDFERRWTTALLAFVCGALCLEWLIRRLSKLA